MLVIKMKKIYVIDKGGYELSHIYRNMCRTPNPAHPSEDVKEECVAQEHNTTKQSWTDQSDRGPQSKPPVETHYMYMQLQADVHVCRILRTVLCEYNTDTCPCSILHAILYCTVLVYLGHQSVAHQSDTTCNTRNTTYLRQV